MAVSGIAVRARTESGLGAVAIGVTCVVVVSALFFASHALQPVVPLDEGIDLVYPDLILRGYVPNRDFASLYPPGTYWLLAAIYQVFGTNIVVERLTGFGYILAIALAIFVIVRRRGVVAASLVAMLVSVVLILFPTAIGAFSWFGAAALMLWSLVAAGRWAAMQARTALTGWGFGWPVVLSGMLAGLAICFRHDLAPAIVLSGLATIGLRRGSILGYGIGGLVGFSPLLVHTVIATPAAVIQNLLWDVLLASPTRKLPLDPSDPLLWLVGLSCIVPAICAALVLMMSRRWMSDRALDRPLLGTAVLCLCVLPQTLSRADPWHLTYVGCFTVPLSCAALLDVFVAWRRTRRGVKSATIRLVPPLQPRHSAYAAVAAAVALVAGAGFMVATREGADLTARLYSHIDCAACVTNEGRRVPVQLRDRAGLQEIIDTLEARSAPGDRLFVGPHDLTRPNYSDSYFFFLFPKLAPGTFYIEVASAVANRPGTRMTSDLAHARFAVLNTAWDDWHEANSSSIAGSAEPMKVLDRQFCLIMSRPPFQLYEQCDPASKVPKS